MRMKKSFVLIFIFILASLTPLTSFAGDQEDAEKAAKQILSLIQNRKYEDLWSTKMSEFFRSKMTKDSFLANMTMGRQQLGVAINSKFIDMAYSKVDPASGTKGEIYAFNYLDTYTIGKFYERIVVIKEKDGVFRLAGLWGSPAPK